MSFGFFGSPELDEPDFSEAEIAGALASVKRTARRRRLTLVAPAAFLAAVAGAFLAAPPNHGELGLIADADASADNEVPWVFGANGVWSLAEPIASTPSLEASGEPAAVVEMPAPPQPPDFELAAPAAAEPSLPVSVPTPPTSTPGQFAPADGDWTPFAPQIRISPAPEPVATAEPEAEVQTSAPASPDASTQPSDEQTVPSGDAAAAATSADEPSGTNPSTSPAALTDSDDLRHSEPPVIMIESVLVHSAHVSVTVRVVDDDSSVIDWCNTRVDWGDGTVTWVAGSDEAAACAAACERAAASSGSGIDAAVTFTHTYQAAINAAPIVVVSTGDACVYQQTLFQLNPFAVLPY